MTSNNQVSPVIRISRGERDASARATHLKAASRKYLETTIERKQMSTTTNFKRIALVAVAALGLGVLSSVPSNAAINADTVTLSSATAAQTTAETYTSTSAVATVSFFGAQNDSMSITAALTAAPAGNTSLPTLQLLETSSAVVESNTATGLRLVVGDTKTANSAVSVKAAQSTVVTTAKFAVYLTSTNGVTAPSVAGTYTVKITPAGVGAGVLQGSTAQTLTITVSTAATLSKNVSAANSLSQIVQFGSTYDPVNVSTTTTDSSVVAVKTASTTPVAVIFAKGYNAAGVALTATGESLTATVTGSGTLGIVASGSYPTSGAQTITGKSISLRQTDYLLVFADGNAGDGTITITGSVSGVTIATKTVKFSSDTYTKFGASTIAATDSSVIAVSGTTKVSALAQDAQSYLVTGLTGGTDLYAFSSDTSVATVGTPSYGSATVGYSTIVTGVKAGTADIVFGNASTLAASTIKSAPVTVRVGSGTSADVKLTTDKTSYAPGEKITLTVTILDSTAKPVVGKASYTGIFTSTGLVANMALGSNSDTLPTADIANYSNTTNTKTYTLYAPVNGGTLTISGTGGTGLATANQVAKSVSVTITDNASAALAAVTALATTVASLKTLIVTLTNLVLKIQKKVKA